MELYLGHVAACDYLLKADYHCPYHGWDENFNVSHVDSKFKKACGVFKDLGCIGHRRRRILMDNAEELPTNAGYPHGRAEADGAPSKDLREKHFPTVNEYSVPGSPGFEMGPCSSYVPHPYPHPMELPGSPPPPRSEATSPGVSWRRAEVPSPQSCAWELRATREAITTELPSPDIRSHIVHDGSLPSRNPSSTSARSRQSFQRSSIECPQEGISSLESSVQHFNTIDASKSGHWASIPSHDNGTSQRISMRGPRISIRTSGLHEPPRCEPIESSRTPAGSLSKRCSTSPDRAASLNDGLVSPISPCLASSTDPRNMTLISPMDQASTKQSPLSTIEQRLHGASQVPGTNANPQYQTSISKGSKASIQFASSVHRGTLASTRMLVDRLHQASQTTERYFQRLLDTKPELCVVSNGVNVTSTFDEGLRNLKNCLEGNIPTSLSDVFTLVSLGYACALVCQGKKRSPAWDAFYRNVFYPNILQWGMAIPERQDRYLFFRIAGLLWSASPPYSGPAALFPLASRDLSANRGIAQPSIATTCPLGVFNHELSASHQQYQQADLNPTPEKGLLLSLRDGAVIGCCTRFLDDVAYANIQEPTIDEPANDGTVPVATKRSVSYFQSIIIDPLLSRQDVCEKFGLLIQDTWRAIQHGQLKSIRDVEVMLLSGSHGRLGTLEDYVKYRELVTTLCNTSSVAKSLGSSWRASYQASHVDHVEAIYLRSMKQSSAEGACHESKEDRADRTVLDQSAAQSASPVHQFVTRKRIPSKRIQPIDLGEEYTRLEPQSLGSVRTVDVTMTGDRGGTAQRFSPAGGETPLSATSNKTSSTTDSFVSCSSALTLKSPASSWSQDSTNGSQSVSTNPTTPSSTACTPSTMGPPNWKRTPSQSFVTYCEFCGTGFSGTYQNRISNLKRHLKQFHGEGDTLPCPEYGCETSWPRSDYLRKHLKDAHDISDPELQHSDSKRPRRSSYRSW